MSKDIVVIRTVPSSSKIPTLYEGCSKTITVPTDKHGKYFIPLTKEQQEAAFKSLIPDYAFADDRDKAKMVQEFLVNWKYRLRSVDTEIDKSTPAGLFEYTCLVNNTQDVAASPEDLKDRPTCTHYLVDVDAEAKNELSKALRTNEAISIIKKLISSPDKLNALARVIGDDAPEAKTINVVASSLIKMAETRPDVIIAFHTDPLVEFKNILRIGTKYEVVRVDNDNYYYNSKLLGISLEAAADYLSSPENQGVFLAIRKTIETKGHAFGSEKLSVKDEDNDSIPEVKKVAVPETTGNSEPPAGRNFKLI